MSNDQINLIDVSLENLKLHFDLTRKNRIKITYDRKNTTLFVELLKKKKERKNESSILRNKGVRYFVLFHLGVVITDNTKDKRTTFIIHKLQLLKAIDHRGPETAVCTLFTGVS